MTEQLFKLFYGKYVQNMRDTLDLSQEEVAHQIGISKDALSRIERGINAPKFATSLALEYLLNLDHAKIQREFQKHVTHLDLPTQDKQ